VVRRGTRKKRGQIRFRPKEDNVKSREEVPGTRGEKGRKGGRLNKSEGESWELWKRKQYQFSIPSSCYLYWFSCKKEKRKGRSQRQENLDGDFGGLIQTTPRGKYLPHRGSASLIGPKKGGRDNARPSERGALLSALGALLEQQASQRGLQLGG